MPKKKSKGITIKKDDDFSEWYSQVVQKAELADMRYGVQGFIVHMPWATRIARKIYEYFEEAVEDDDHEPMLLPTVIPEENLKKEEEHAGFVPEVFWVTQAGTQDIDRKFGLRPTGETQIYPMYSLWIRSYNDLPFKRYQSRITTFRNEMTTRPFMRGREFMFFETHDVFQTKEESLDQIEKDMGMMEDVVSQKLLLPFIFLRRPQWDKFLGAVDTFASDTLNPDGRRTQISSTHYLGTNFAKPFNVTYTDEKGKEQFAHQTCFGPGIWRILASLIAIHGDDQGLVLPFDVSPLHLVIVPILFAGKDGKNKKTLAACEKIKKIIKELGYKVKTDARKSVHPGEKFNDWEMRGVPLRVEIGPKEAENNQATLVRRIDKIKESITIEKKILAKKIEEHAKNLNKEIKARAEKYFENNTREASNYAEVKKLLKEHRGFVVAPFISLGKNGEKYAEKLKEETGAHICGEVLHAKKPKGKKCFMSKEPANHMVYIAKSI